MVLDALARRYGQLPHQLLSLSPLELRLAYEAARAGGEAEQQEVERARQEAGRGRR